MSRAEKMNKILKTLSTNTPDVEAAAIVDNDGLMIASAMPADSDEDSVAAMSAALLGLGERITTELSRGGFEMVMLRGSDGLVIMTRAGDDAMLVVLTSKRAKLGLIFLDIKRASSELASLLS